MRKIRKIGLALLLGGLLLDPILSQARLGESKGEIEKRFGKALVREKIAGVGLEQVIYRNRDLRIGVTYAKGKSVSEQYIRAKSGTMKEKVPTVLPIPEGLAKLILERNVEGSEWEKVSETEKVRRYRRKDNLALASIFLQDGIMVEVRISSAAFQKHLQQVAKKRQ